VGNGEILACYLLSVGTIFTVMNVCRLGGMINWYTSLKYDFQGEGTGGILAYYLFENHFCVRLETILKVITK